MGIYFRLLKNEKSSDGNFFELLLVPKKTHTATPENQDEAQAEPNVPCIEAQGGQTKIPIRWASPTIIKIRKRRRHYCMGVYRSRRKSSGTIYSPMLYSSGYSALQLMEGDGRTLRKGNQFKAAFRGRCSKTIWKDVAAVASMLRSTFLLIHDVLGSGLG